MSTCSVSVESLSSDQLPADITAAGRQPEEMGIAQDEQPQLNTVPNREN